jgi:hypothetical protein
MFEAYEQYDFGAEKKAKLVTPYFPAQWIYLAVTSTKFKAEGEYKLTLRVPADHPFLKALDDLTALGVAHELKGLKPIDIKKQGDIVTTANYAVELDAETADETGFCLVGIKTQAQYKDKKTGEIKKLTPKVFDSRGKLVDPKKLKIGNGSIVSVNMSPSCYRAAGLKKTGVALYLNAVQIKKLEAYDGGGAGAFGFGTCSDEDAYEYEEESFESAEAGSDIPEGQEF